MMATLRREFFAVPARVGFRFAGNELAAPDWTFLEDSGLELEGSADWERKGFEVKKGRLRGRLAQAVRWNERRGRGGPTAL